MTGRMASMTTMTCRLDPRKRPSEASGTGVVEATCRKCLPHCRRSRTVARLSAERTHVSCSQSRSHLGAKAKAMQGAEVNDTMSRIIEDKAMVVLETTLSHVYRS